MVVGDFASLLAVHDFAVNMTILRMVIDAQNVLAAGIRTLSAGRRRSYFFSHQSSSDINHKIAKL